MTPSKKKTAGYTSPGGKYYLVKPGRPPLNIRKPTCKHCGKLVTYRPDRKTQFCKKCFNLLFRPPLRIKGGLRLRAGGLICPHCHSFRQTYSDDGEVTCRVCGCVIL